MDEYLLNALYCRLFLIIKFLIDFMNRILIIGSGRSSAALIQYMLNHAEAYKWNIMVADTNLESAKQKINGHPRGQATWLDVMKTNDKKDLISRADLVITLLPAHLHLEVAYDCIKLNKPVITSSYVTKEMYRLGDEARDKELLFMGEMGLDPGLDHMSAKNELDELRAEGAKILSFKSYTGGLIAEKNKENPWDYKFTWNPRNVVLAGQGTAQYLENNRLKFIPYGNLFQQTQTVEIDGLGNLEAYINRDSLLYREFYGLQNIPNVLKGTLRYPGFCEAWNALIQLGLTDGDFPVLNSGEITYHEWMDAYSSKEEGNSVKERVAKLLGEHVESPIMNKLTWLGLFRKKKINLPNATPALILEHLLLEKWQLDADEKDLVVMKHEIDYLLDGAKKRRTATLTLSGEDGIYTAMSKIIGLPIGIFAKYFVEKKITVKGLHVPVMREFYKLALEEMEQYGVAFKKKDEFID